METYKDSLANETACYVVKRMLENNKIQVTTIQTIYKAMKEIRPGLKGNYGYLCMAIKEGLLVKENEYTASLKLSQKGKELAKIVEESNNSEYELLKKFNYNSLKFRERLPIKKILKALSIIANECPEEMSRKVLAERIVQEIKSENYEKKLKYFYYHAIPRLSNLGYLETKERQGDRLTGVTKVYRIRRSVSAG